MTTPRRSWTRAEHLIVLRYYLQTEFGRFHSRNPEIRAIAGKLGRTPGSIAMKCSNYASLDPVITDSGRKGLNQASRMDREAWSLMQDSFEVFEDESASVAIKFGLDPATLTPFDQAGVGQDEQSDLDMEIPGPTESRSTVSIRRKQNYFRRTVLAAYRNTCPISGIAMPELLNASHIIPWKVDIARRVDPTNGIALNALHDRAFDRGLISFGNDLTVLVSSQLRSARMPETVRFMIQGVEGTRATQPDRFRPDEIALEYHRDVIFAG